MIGDVSTPLFGFNDGTVHLFDLSDGHLVRTFALASIAGNGLFWIVLGAASGFLLRRTRPAS